MPAHIHWCEPDELRSRGRFGCERAQGEHGGREENLSHDFHDVSSENPSLTYYRIKQCQ
jgi:hypothetical protein